MSSKELFRRYILFTIGMFVTAAGLSLVIKASLGSSPISSLPYTISIRFPLSIGMLTFILNAVLLAGQILILGNRFERKQWLQMPISILFGLFIDLCMAMWWWVEPDHYMMKIFTLIAGCAILGFGISLEIIANVVMLSGEAFVKAIAVRFGKEFGMMKICFDVTMTILACITSFILLDRLAGVREGTVIAAVLVGIFARFFNNRIKFLNPFLQDGFRTTIYRAFNKYHL